MDLKTNDANVYNTFWIASLTENISGNSSFTVLKNNFCKIIGPYEGASGPMKLDSYGDRFGPYDLWMIRENVNN